MGRSKINMIDFELLLREQTIREWKDMDQIHPHDAHAPSRVMRTYHTHFGVPIGCQIGFWDDQKRATKPTLPSYLRHNIPNHLSRALSRLRLSGHNLNIEQLRRLQHRVPYELRICTKCNWHCAPFFLSLRLFSLGPGCRPSRFQLSCPQSADTAM